MGCFSACIYPLASSDVLFCYSHLFAAHCCWPFWGSPPESTALVQAAAPTLRMDTSRNIWVYLLHICQTTRLTHTGASCGTRNQANFLYLSISGEKMKPPTIKLSNKNSVRRFYISKSGDGWMPAGNYCRTEVKISHVAT